MLSIELDATDVGENNTAVGLVKYLASIACSPAPYYLHLYLAPQPLFTSLPKLFLRLVYNFG